MSDLGDTKSVSVSILGPVQVTRGSATVDIGAARLKTLLVLLCIRKGESVPAERLIEELWEESPPAGAKATLQSYVSNLRKDLGAAVILTTGGGYRLGPEVDLDLTEFEECIRSNHLGSTSDGSIKDGQLLLERACDIWRGSFAEDIRPLDRLDRFAKIVDEQRLMVSALRLEMLVTNSPEQSIVELRSLRVEYPLDEKLVGLLMSALAAVGRRAEALRECHEFRQELVEQTGIGPSATIRELERSLVAEETSPPAKPKQAPKETLLVLAKGNSFVRQQAQFDQACEAVLNRRLVTLVGPGGVGKSRIATEVIEHLKTQFTDVVFRDLSETDQDQSLAELLREISDQTSNTSGQNRSILFLDNCEYFVPSVSAAVNKLLRDRPNIHVIATSRCRLDMPSERVLLVQPLSTVPEEAEALSLAARLLVDRMESFGQLVERHDWPFIENVAAAADGLPLMLELAAERAAGLGLKTYASQGPSMLDNLSSLRVVEGHRHQSAMSLMGWTLDQLSPEHRRLITALTVFEGPFTLEAAEVVGKILEVAVGSSLTKLIDQSLVSKVPDEGTVQRYVILKTLRRVLKQEYDQLDTRREVEWAFVKFFAKRASEVVPDVRQMSGSQRASALHPDQANLLAGLKLAQRHGAFTEGVGLFWAFLWHCHELDSLADIRRWLLESLKGSESDSADNVAIARAHVSVIALSFYLSSPEATEDEAVEAVSHARAVGDPWLLADALSLQGARATNAGYLTTAFAALAEASDVCESIDHIWGLAIVDLFRAIAERRAHRLEPSYQFGRKALERLEYVDDKRGVSLATRTMARTLHDMGRVSDAQDLAARSYKIAVETKDHAAMAMAALAYGQVVVSVENFDFARTLFVEALTAGITAQNETLICSSLKWITYVDFFLFKSYGALAFVDGFTSQRRTGQPRPKHDTVLKKARGSMGSDLFDMERRRGQNASLDSVLDRLDISLDF